MHIVRLRGQRLPRAPVPTQAARPAHCSKDDTAGAPRVRRDRGEQHRATRTDQVVALEPHGQGRSCRRRRRLFPHGDAAGAAGGARRPPRIGCGRLCNPACSQQRVRGCTPIHQSSHPPACQALPRWRGSTDSSRPRYASSVRPGCAAASTRGPSNPTSPCTPPPTCSRR